MNVAIGVVVVILVSSAAQYAVLRWFRARAARLARPLHPEALTRVEFDDVAIRVTVAGRAVDSARWSALTKIVLLTTDKGPFQADVFWCLHSAAGVPVVVFPGGATGEKEILAAFQTRLAGFRDEEVIKAMGSTANASFVIWEAPSGVDKGEDRPHT